jgi:hypothetical protein
LAERDLRNKERWRDGYGLAVGVGGIVGVGKAEPRGEDVEELNGDDDEHAEVGAEEAEDSAESVPGLSNDDAATDGGGNFGRDVVFDEAGAGGVAPTGVKHDAKDEDVAPVLE